MSATPSLFDRLWRAQDGCCFHCGEEMCESRNHERQWSREHIYPRSRYSGGPIVLAHRSCNSARRSRGPTPDEITGGKAIYAAIGLPWVQAARRLGPELGTERDAQP